MRQTITVTDKPGVWDVDGRLLEASFDLDSCHGCSQFGADLPAGVYELAPVGSLVVERAKCGNCGGEGWTAYKTPEHIETRPCRSCGGAGLTWPDWATESMKGNGCQRFQSCWIGWLRHKKTSRQNRLTDHMSLACHFTHVGVADVLQGLSFGNAVRGREGFDIA